MVILLKKYVDDVPFKWFILHKQTEAEWSPGGEDQYCKELTIDKNKKLPIGPSVHFLSTSLSVSV